MAAKEVYHETTIVENESHQVSQTEEGQTLNIITKQKVKLNIERKPAVFGCTSR